MRAEQLPDPNDRGYYTTIEDRSIDIVIGDGNCFFRAISRVVWRREAS